MPDRPLLILFGSQTGTAEEVADRLAAESLRWHFVPRVVPMEEYDVARLPAEPFVVCVASTTGEGEVPDGMRPLWSFLLRRDLPPTLAQSMKTQANAIISRNSHTFLL